MLEQWESRGSHTYHGGEVPEIHGADWQSQNSESHEDSNLHFSCDLSLSPKLAYGTNALEMVGNEIRESQPRSPESQ